MRKMKYSIVFLLIFMIIGYAAVSVSLSLGGNASILDDLDDFRVYFSDVKLNGKQDLRFVKNDKELSFSLDFLNVGAQHVISYDVTNASSVFDASLSINCTQGDEYLLVSNDFDVSTNLTSKSTRTGTLTLKKLKSNSSEDYFTVNVICTIVASPIEKDSVVDDSVGSPVQPIELQTGDVIGIDGEYFNIISQTEDTVTMLAQYNLGTNYRQSTINNYVSFSNTNGWEYTPGPKEIDIQQYDGNAKTYVNEYVSYLRNKTGESTINGTLITMKELKSLGCANINDDYSLDTSRLTCMDSVYKNWLVNDQSWWTHSAYSNHANIIWGVFGATFNYDGYGSSLGIRPVITIPIELARLHYVKTYAIGEEVSIGSEKFNVIKDNGDTVTMLAQYNLGTNYRQSTTNNYVMFSGFYGWEYTPGPKEIDIQTWSADPKTYVNEYVSYLKGETGNSTLTGTLITMSELKTLGCTINDDYSYSSDLTCANSAHKSWLVNGNSWWTRSALPNNSDNVWLVSDDCSLSYAHYRIKNGVRPVITISKDAL